MTVEKVWNYELDEFASALGSVYMCNDRSIQIEHGSQGRLIEVTRDGNVIFELDLMSYYRAYPIKLY